MECWSPSVHALLRPAPTPPSARATVRPESDSDVESGDDEADVAGAGAGATLGQSPRATVPQRSMGELRAHVRHLLALNFRDQYRCARTHTLRTASHFL